MDTNKLTYEKEQKCHSKAMEIISSLTDEYTEFEIKRIGFIMYNMKPDHFFDDTGCFRDH